MKITIMLTVLVCISVSGFAATLTVPINYPTIQGAINATQPGDTVLVLPGTYVENINFIGKAITVKSDQGADVTTIDGGNPSNPDFGSVACFTSGEGLNSILDGFTITNGWGTWTVYPTMSGYNGAGIYCSNSSPTIKNNLIVGNKTRPGNLGWGGGIGCYNYASPLIIHNVISENNASNTGGGIDLFEYCSPTITQNTLIQNTAEYGGGVSCWSFGTPMILENRIEKNIAKESVGGVSSYECDPIISNNLIIENEANGTPNLQGYGGGIGCQLSSATIVNNTIYGNSASFGAGISLIEQDSSLIANNLIHGNSADRGAGIDCYMGCSPEITNNTLFANEAQNGGGMACRNSSTATVTNSIFWNNTASNNGPEIFIGSQSNPSTVTISYSDVDGGKASVYIGSNCTLIWGAGMIDADPLFVSPANGDFHIPHHSPCCGTGDNNCSSLPSEDFEGDPRICYGNADMGADEHFRHLYYTGDATPGGSVDVIFTGLPGTTPVGLIAGFGLYDPPLKSMWGDWYVMLPWVGPIHLGAMPSPNGVLPINILIPGTPPGPYSVYMQAIIGAELTNLCTLEVK